MVKTAVKIHEEREYASIGAQSVIPAQNRADGDSSSRINKDLTFPENKTGWFSKILTLIAVIVPPLGILSAAKILWGTDLHFLDIYLFLGFYAFTGFGITVGYHRLFTHKAFETNTVIRVILAILGAMTLQGPLTQWVSDHRRHHMLSDKKGDPHSPNLDGDKIWDHITGLAHAHVGWMFRTKGLLRNSKYVEDIYDDKYLMLVDRLYLFWVLLSLFLPFLLGYLVSGNLEIATESFVWAGLIRIALFQHATFAVNSICHKFGNRQYRTRDNSKNQWLVAALTFGEGWHNNHHAFPRSARHGLGKFQVDISWLVISLLQKMKLVHGICLPKESQMQKLKV